jgi:hypothetical protein
LIKFNPLNNEDLVVKITIMTKKKGLQRFTDFESIKTAEDFRKFKKENPDSMDLLYDYIKKKLNEVVNAPKKKEGELDKYFDRATINGGE